MTRNPLVYIVLPCYNGEKYLLEQLMSIYYQNYTNWYLIFVNDWSTDNSETLARDWISHYNLHNKVKIISKENWGLNSAIQRWLEEVKELCDINDTDSLVAYCDADDIWTRDKLEVQVNYMIENPEFWMTYHKAEWINQDGGLIRPHYMDHSYREEKFLHISTIWNRYSAPSMMFRAECIDYIIPMPLWKAVAQDTWTAVVLWLNNIKIHFIDKSMFYRRFRQWSMQWDFIKKDNIEQWKIRMENFIFLQKRFPDKDLSYIYNYNNDRYIVRQQKWYWRMRIYLCMLFKYPKIFFKGLKAFLLSKLHLV